MSEPKKKAAWPWITVPLVMGLIVAYPLSFAVVFVLDILQVVPKSWYPAIQTIYAPIVWLLRQ